MSFSTVCLSIGIQVIKLNSKMFRWTSLKIQSLEFIGYCCLFTWFLYILIKFFLPFIVNGPSKSKNLSIESNSGVVSLYTFLYFLSDMMSLIFMIWEIMLEVIVFHRHNQRVQHIHNSSLSSCCFMRTEGQ